MSSTQDLRLMISAMIGVDPAEIGVDDNVIGLGLDSIGIMTMVGRWQRAGMSITFADLMEQPTIRAWSALVEAARCGDTPAAAVAAADSDPAAPFALTPTQHAYWIGRTEGFGLGGTACHAYFEFDAREVDPPRLERAMRRVIARHGMLRARFADDGTQQILPTSPWTGLTVHDLRGRSNAEVGHRLAEVREELGHRCLDVGRGQVVDLQLSLFDADPDQEPGCRGRLHLEVDLLCADVLSIQILLADLGRAYGDDTGLAPITYSFPQFLTDRAEQTTDSLEMARAYWHDRIDTMPSWGPKLPLRTDPESVRRPRFVRREHRMASAAWARFAAACAEYCVTPSMALAAAFGEVLGRWSSESRFLLNVPLFGRHSDDPDIDSMIADFTNLLLLEIESDGRSSFAAAAARLQKRFATDVSHAGYSAVTVLRELGKATGQAAAAPVVFASSLGGEFVDHGFQRQFGDMTWMVSQTPQVWLDHQVYESAGGLLLTWDSVDDLFPETVIDSMFDAYRRLVEHLGAPGADWTSTGPELMPAHQLEVRAAVNATAGPIPPGLLHEGLVDQARRTPERTAVVAADRTVTYGELLGSATATAHNLRDAGMREGEIVAVSLDKGWAQIAAVVGVLLAGGVYLPLDLAQPAARRDAIMADARVRHVLIDDGALVPQPWPAGITTVGVALGSSSASGSGPPRHGRGPDDLAYVIYTSGSTGSPKGVMVGHRSALNTVRDVTERWAVNADDTVLGLASLSFDLSVYDVFGPLAVGATLVLPGADRRGDPSHWADLMARHRVTIWNSVPAQLQMLDNYLDYEDVVVDDLRLAMLSGDWIPVALPDSIRGKAPGLEVVSLGGATEAAIWSIAFPVGELDPRWRSIPYGLPMTNQTFHVLDDAMRHVPDLVAGELYIGGIGLAQGYLGDPDRTAARFVTRKATGERLYRTGDFGRYHPGGVIEFLGRTDSQVKIRGHRIELGEIEQALSGDPSVGAAIVLVEGDRPLERRLAAFVEPALDRAAGAARRGESGGLVDGAVAAGASVMPADLCTGDVTEFRQVMDRAQVLAMWAALRAAGLFGRTSDRADAATVVARTGAALRHHRLLRRWLRVLTTEGMLDLDGEGGYGASGRVPGDDDLPAAMDAAWGRVEEIRRDDLCPPDRISYLRGSAGHLLELLRDDIDQIRLFFPDGGLETARSIFTDNLIARHLNATVVGAVLALAQTRSPLRILEVGAGIGGTSDGLIAALADHEVDYLFTDVTQFFLNEARQHFTGLDQVRFGIFDMNADHRVQGLDTNTFDVVLAANVLHNAHDAPAVLTRLGELLASGGHIVMLEATREHYELMTSMEFLVRVDTPDGDFRDLRRGRDRVFLTEHEWSELLVEAGGEVELCLPRPDGPLGDVGQHVLVARFKTDRARTNTTEVLERLATRLPAHMLPSGIQVVDRIPVTANGKIDRSQLRAWLHPASVAAPTAEPEGPRDELEADLAAIWCSVLGRDRTGRDQSFFDLGGDSLLVTQVINRVREAVPEAATCTFGELLRVLTGRATVADLADALRADT